jgi:hypothetical protein
MKNSFIKHALIAGATIFTMAWVAVFAQTNVQTNILNAVQTIMRTVYTTNGAQNGGVLAIINTGSRIYLSGGILSNATGVSILGLDANNLVTTNITLSGGNIQWPMWPQWATGATWPQWPAGPQGPQGATGYSVVAMMGCWLVRRQHTKRRTHEYHLMTSIHLWAGMNWISTIQ